MPMALMTMAWLGFGALGPWGLGLGAIPPLLGPLLLLLLLFLASSSVAPSGLYGLAAAYLLVGGR
jgi:hypothetical protein